MILSIQQPEYFPWLGYFDKILHVDKIVFLDNVQFKKRYFENRNKIRTTTGSCWIRTPVLTKGRYTQRIMDVEIDNTQKWQNKLANSIRHSYSKSIFWKNSGDELCEVIESKPYVHLADFNLAIIFFLMNKIGIHRDYCLASSIKTVSTGSDLVLDICKAMQADVYFSGRDGKNYLNDDLFAESGIEIIYQNFKHPEYTQFHGKDFLPAMSVIDLFFNHGPKSKHILSGNES